MPLEGELPPPPAATDMALGGRARGGGGAGKARAPASPWLGEGEYVTLVSKFLSIGQVQYGELQLKFGCLVDWSN